MVTKQLDIKNRTYYFFNDLIWLDDFNPNLLKLDKKLFEDMNIYYIGYVTKNPEYSIDTVNLLFLIIKELEGYVEEYNGSKYLTITLTPNNQVSIDYAKVWYGISEQIKKINGGSVNEWDKDYMQN